jgi:hypothetical protein
MLEGDKKVARLHKNLILAQLFFSENVRLAIENFYQYFPIDKYLDKKIEEFRISTNGDVRISEGKKNDILIETDSALLSSFNKLLNIMNEEK